MEKPLDLTIDYYDCPRDDCDIAYPHPLLVDKHILDDHENDVQEYIDGENDIWEGSD